MSTRSNTEKCYHSDVCQGHWPAGENIRGLGTEFIEHLWPPMSEAERRAVLYVRITSPGKKNAIRLKQAVSASRRTLERRGFEIIKIVSGVEFYSILGRRPLLEEAIECARAHGAILIAPSRDRFLRHHGYRWTNITEKPMINEYRFLKGMAKGVRLATILHPNRNGRGAQTRRGQVANDAAMGRPKGTRKAGWCIQRRKIARDWVIEWRNQGWSYQKITDWCREREWANKYFAPSIKTIWNWVNWRLLKSCSF